jgi:3-oxoacyl-[acyl-carrier-protein] synthase-1
MPDKRRVVVTGLGIISSLGNSFSEVISSLSAGKSGIETVQEWVDIGLEISIAGTLKNVDQKRKQANIANNQLKYASDSAIYCILAAKDAIDSSGLSSSDLASSRTGCIVGSGSNSLQAIYEAGQKLYSGQAKRISPYIVCQSMTSSCSASIANIFSIKGRSYSIGSACATSAHNLGHAYELIREGVLDTAITGGGEEVSAMSTAAFSAMRLALSYHYNDTPHSASRPYDKNRDGFVISGGSGIVILEAYEKAKSRGAQILAEVFGFAANSEGDSMILPGANGDRIAACMSEALDMAGLPAERIDYINTHGTATIEGDIAEILAIKQVFKAQVPALSSTKSMSGHAIGAAGVNEFIFCIGMLQEQFIAPSINIDTIDPKFADVPIITKPTSKPLDMLMTNSFGFGGTNAVIILGCCHD